MLQPDSSLGPYRLIARIGAGGMGEVWKAEDTRLGRTVAIKVLPARVVADADATARMKREARTAAQLYHANIATIHSIEEDGDRLFIVMEFVEGEPLTKMIRRGGMSESEICRVGRGVADALAEAHAKGIVHRDIKPDNVIVSGARVKVLDFGIAKQVGVVDVSPDAPTAFETRQGLLLGTIHYMSPEQALGKKVDARTDIFSLGVVLYQAATERLPFQGETITDTMTQIIRDEPPDAADVNPGISTALNAIIHRCLRKNPDERFRTADELRDALDRLLAAAPTEPYTAGTTKKTVAALRPRKSRAALFAIIGAVLIAGALAAVLLARRHPSVGAPASGARPRAAAPTQTVVTVTAPQPVPAPAPQPVVVVKKPEPKPQLEPPSPPDPYAEGMSDLLGGNVLMAREKFHQAIKNDPHNAKAHFRLAEIALFGRNLPHAEEQARLALRDPDRLDDREQALARLVQAMAGRDRFEAEQMARDIRARWPDDPDLTRIERSFGDERPKLRRRRPF
jgi:predicted Ser/Thr protein kinase